MEPIVWVWGRQSTLWISCLIPGLSKYGLWEDDIMNRYGEKQLYGQQHCTKIYTPDFQISSRGASSSSHKIFIHTVLIYTPDFQIWNKAK